MIVQVQGLPPCNHCQTPPVLERVGPEGEYRWFVICRSDDCAKRLDNTMTVGRPLSNGKPSQAEAESDWTTHVRKMVDAKAEGYRL